MKKKYSLVLISFFLAIVFGCKKSDENLFDTKYQNIAKENALIHGIFDDVLKISEDILMNNGDAKIDATGAPLGCYVTIDTVITGVNQKRYTITFDQNCTSYDGKKRSGVITINLQGNNYNVSGTVATIQFNNFLINDYQVKGKMVVSNEGSDIFKVVVSDEEGSGFATIYLPDIQKESKWKAVYKKILYEGNADMVIINNKYKIDTYDETIIPFQGITTDNYYYATRINSPLILNNGCIGIGKVRYPTAGLLHFDLVITNRYVDYGDSTCDASYKMSFGGLSSKLNLY